MKNTQLAHLKEIGAQGAAGAIGGAVPLGLGAYLLTRKVPPRKGETKEEYAERLKRVKMRNAKMGLATGALVGAAHGGFNGMREREGFLSNALAHNIYNTLQKNASTKEDKEEAEWQQNRRKNIRRATLAGGFAGAGLGAIASSEHNDMTRGARVLTKFLGSEGGGHKPANHGAWALGGAMLGAGLTRAVAPILLDGTRANEKDGATYKK